MFNASRAMSDEFCGVLGLAGLVLWRVSSLSGDSPRRRLWIAGAGCALGLATLVRATGILFLLALVIAALWTRAPAGRTLALAALALVPALAWSVRSSALEGRPVFVHSLGAYNFWMGEASARYGFAPDPGGGARRRLLAAEGGLPPARARRVSGTSRSSPETARLETR